jgi:hypothetical protein
MLLWLLLLTPGCASMRPDAVAASCPPPPPAPQAVTAYVSPATSLIDDSEKALEDFRNDLLQSLQKASGESI